MQTSPSGRMPLYASVAVIVVLIGAFAFYYVTSTGTISSLNSSISSQQGVIGAQGSTIAGQSSSISSLTGVVSTLQANITAYQTLVADLHSMIAADTAEIATLNTKLTADNTTINNLNSQIATASALAANLTTELDLGASHTLLNGQTETIWGTSATTATPFVSFSALHAGYVLVAVTGATVGWLVDLEYTPNLNNPSGASYSSIYGLGLSSPAVEYVIVPIAPGNSNQLFLLTTGTANGSGSVTATYFY